MKLTGSEKIVHYARCKLGSKVLKFHIRTCCTSSKQKFLVLTSERAEIVSFDDGITTLGIGELQRDGEGKLSLEWSKVELWAEKRTRSKIMVQFGQNT